ncbi:hypothetical protein HNQ51_001964 [Inhella inkyongensis]|uniref:DUF1415 domain-containing protein n=1 Tax=Inhella inkyongensis TaxID=392593 RepID=A0A840S890_9BURK|nr:DUF1415 domain-containing protein [Inhella inkyongensis]MBB5204650.1 hypothetical protein [Inhella inkyongensis]
MTNDEQVIANTRAWVDKAVIGLNLCPFAKQVQVKGQVRYVVSHATTVEDLLYELAAELNRLVDTPPEETDTTLLIHPQVLTDFLDYNDFLEAADALVGDIGLDGVLQVASFHPDYQFEGTEPDDISNYTNRSPYPTLHLLREESIDRAVAAFPEPDSIFDANIATLEKLGHAGWEKLGLKG